MYQILKDDLEKLEILNGHNPRIIHWGTEWAKAQQKKKIKLPAGLKDYTK